MLTVRQSSSMPASPIMYSGASVRRIPGWTDTYCQQEGGVTVAFTNELLEATWYCCGGAHRRSFRGGWAYGMPRNSATVGATGEMRPWTVRLLLSCTTGDGERE